MKIVSLRNKEEIEGILKEFLPVIPRLAEKKHDLKEYAEKISKTAIVMVEKNNDTNTGLIVFYSNDTETKIGYVALIAVKNDYQKCGIGKNLLKHASEDMRKKQMKTMELAVNKKNLNALSFYKYIGFKIKCNIGNELILKKDL